MRKLPRRLASYDPSAIHGVTMPVTRFSTKDDRVESQVSTNGVAEGSALCCVATGGFVAPEGKNRDVSKGFTKVINSLLDTVFRRLDEVRREGTGH